MLSAEGNTKNKEVKGWRCRSKSFVPLWDSKVNQSEPGSVFQANPIKHPIDLR